MQAVLSPASKNSSGGCIAQACPASLSGMVLAARLAESQVSGPRTVRATHSSPAPSLASMQQAKQVSKTANWPPIGPPYMSTDKSKHCHFVVKGSKCDATATSDHERPYDKVVNHHSSQMPIMKALMAGNTDHGSDFKSERGACKAWIPR